jgi:hypothetical protein
MIPVEELFESMRDDVAFLSRDGDRQVVWMWDNHWDLDELIEIFCDSVAPGWFPRLESAGLLDDEVRRALLELKAVLLALGHEPEFWSDDGVRSDERWDAVRAVAGDALAQVDRLRPDREVRTSPNRVSLSIW